MVHPSGDQPLASSRICLVFDHSLSHYSRLLLEIEALQDGGATVELLTQHQNPEAPDGVATHEARRQPARLSDRHGSIRLPRPANRVWNLARKVTRRAVAWWDAIANSARYGRSLRRLAGRVDAFWVIDFPRLQVVLHAAQESGARVVYETVDLVPEYQQHGESHRTKSLDLERRLIGDVDGFITACDSYADYYLEKYGTSGLRRRPVVRDNMPRESVAQIRPTRAPIRFLFLGSLMFDRPIHELIDALAATTSNITLTFQGKNYLSAEAGRRLVDRLRQPDVRGRVDVLGPCAPDDIVEAASAYDVGIVALRGVDENERRASTGKLFTYMAAGIAVLGSELPGIARIVNMHGNGHLVPGMDPRPWAAAMDALGSMPPGAIDEMKQRSLEAARSYAWDKQRPGFIGEFQRALFTPTSPEGAMRHVARSAR